MEEQTKVKDALFISKRTSFVPVELPIKQVPNNAFDIKVYRQREWVLMFLDRAIYDAIKAGCEKRDLDVKKVLYGAIMKTKELVE